MTSTKSMNIQGYLEDTYRIIKEEPIILILGGLVVQLLTILTMGILAGPFMGGYFLLITRYLRDKRKPSFNDIFSGLQQFTLLLPYFLVLLTIFIGFMLLIVPGFILSTWWIYVLPLMVDRKIPFGEAMKLSTKKVNETGFLMHLVFLLLITVIPILLLNFLSAMLPFLFVLKILLPPFQACCLVSLYVDQFGPDKIEDDDQQQTVTEEIPIASPPEENEAAELQKADGNTDQDFDPHEPGVIEPGDDPAEHLDTSVKDETPADEPVDKPEQMPGEPMPVQDGNTGEADGQQELPGQDRTTDEYQSDNDINEEKSQN